MTKSEEVYASTLNLLGSDVLAPFMQDIVDREHALADSSFEAELKRRHELTQSVSG